MQGAPKNWDRVFLAFVILTWHLLVKFYTLISVLSNIYLCAGFLEKENFFFDKKIFRIFYSLLLFLHTIIYIKAKSFIVY